MNRTSRLHAILFLGGTVFSCSGPTNPGIENPQTYSLPVPAAISLPYVELEAEDAATTGTASTTTTVHHQAGAEASGRRYVSLDAGEGLTWTVPADSDTLVIRYSYPDSTDGEGQDGTLQVLVDNQEDSLTNLPVTSRHSWEYGTPAWGSTDVWNGVPADGSPRHFWDEASLVLPQAVEQGQTITVRNPTGSGVTVLVDLADFELRPAAVSQPEGSLTFADYSPAANGTSDDTSKLQTAITAAKNQGKTLYIPAGVYKIGSVNVGAVTIQGAGMWRTRFVGPLSKFQFTGGTARLSDFAVLGETAARNDLSDAMNAFAGNPGPDTVLARLWVEHKKCAFWVGVWNNAQGPTRLRITECRFRNLMADAVNFCSGTTDSLLDNNQIRNSGDDGLAAWSPTAGGPSGGFNTFAHNLVQLPWVASGISLYGGGPFRVIGNTVKDTVTTGSGLFVAASFSAHPFQGATEIRDNLLIRSGAHESDPGGPTGAIRVLASDKAMTGGSFTFTNNTVIDPLESAVSIQGPYSVGALTFTGLTVEDAPRIVDVRSSAKGSAVFTGLSVTGSANWSNTAGSNFTLTHP